MALGRAIRAGGAYVELVVRDRLTRGLKRAQRRLKAFGDAATQMGKTMLKAAAVAAAPIALATRTFAAFSDQMLKVKAVTTGTEAEFARLEDTAKRLGRTTSFTASQVAAAMVELGRAGFARTEIDAAIASVLDLARATDTELARAAEIAGSTLRQFNLAAADTTATADILTRAANGSAQTLDDLAEALKMVGPIASAAGEDLTNTAASIAILANNGIKGTMAGTALARAYKNLAAQKTDKMMRSLGVAVADAAGDMRPLADILAEIGKQTKQMGGKQRLAIFEQLFGRGSAAALKLAGAGAKFADMVKIIKDAGVTAAKTAKVMDSGLGGSFRKLRSAVEGAGIAIGKALEGPFKKIGKGITDAVGKITAFLKANRMLVRGFVAGIAIVAAAGVGLIAFGLIVKGVAVAIGLVIGAVKLFTLAMLGAGVMLTLSLIPLASVVAALAKLGGWLTWTSKTGTKAVSWLGKAFQSLKKTVGTVISGITAALRSGDTELAAQILWAGLIVIWTKGRNALDNLWWDIAKTGADAFDWMTFHVARGFAILFDSMKQTMIGWVSGVKMLLADAMEAMLNGMERANAEIKKFFIAAGAGLTISSSKATKMINAIDKEVDASTKRRSKLANIERKRIAADLERRSRASEKERDSTIAALRGEQGERKRLNQAVVDARRKGREKEAKAAEAELDRLEKLAKDKAKAAQVLQIQKDLSKAWMKSMGFVPAGAGGPGGAGAPAPGPVAGVGGGGWAGAAAQMATQAMAAAKKFMAEIAGKVEDAKEGMGAGTAAAMGAVSGTFAGGAVGRMGGRGLSADGRAITGVLVELERLLGKNTREMRAVRAAVDRGMIP